ncbi:MAG: sulfite exporter TauE/SafE family protein, partial [Planctomycetota bacterium]
IFAAVMAAAGLRLLLAASGSAEGAAFPIEYGVPRASAVAAIGVLAGAASPLLGIGGGLIVVPGILLVLPELGMLGARAAALGNAVVTSSRSIQLYAKEGAIDWKLARWIVVGAFAGATLGVQVVHLEGAAALGRSALSFLLVVTALRMGWDVVRFGKSDSGERNR